MSAKEVAANIRSELRALGYNSRQVGVQTEFFALGANVCIIVKDPTCDPEAILRIAKDNERVRRCAVTGDILGGGSVYVGVIERYA